MISSIVNVFSSTLDVVSISLQLYVLLQVIHLKSTGDTVSARMQFVKYGAANGKERSGAYLFLPDGSAKVCMALEWCCCCFLPLADDIHNFILVFTMFFMFLF